MHLWHPPSPSDVLPRHSSPITPLFSLGDRQSAAVSRLHAACAGSSGSGGGGGGGGDDGDDGDNDVDDGDNDVDDGDDDGDDAIRRTCKD